ncbi:uncharacterized protein CTRU02_214869 [Colletotrichum truncatum]|uniref:Uncharacterized protein n=1 Tax=Colletotrichum truncatum TaxID=5467 RepID=A0ACC3YDX1_COLTU|nr:uncharacterized protein CTRU02_08376 [Colletotrichum truncatum]KAF6790247.1 hypothetical protein CTRU02_08376 [Colletotrichum truncatum]
MEHSVVLPSLAIRGEGGVVSRHLNYVDSDAASKHRRKIQNRKNQRAHRQRVKEQEQTSAQAPSPFQVRRWRLDELDDCPSQDAPSESKNATDMYNVRQSTHNTSRRISVRPRIFHGRISTTPVHEVASINPASFIFPLSTDHLLHLVQYNVFRAFISNKSTLNFLLKGWTNKLPSPDDCPISGPYRDDTMVYPLNPNIPVSLVPTRLQQTRYHSIWINLIPFPCVRDNLIRNEGNFDHLDLLNDLIGELMSATPARNKRISPPAVPASDPNNMWTLPHTAGLDEDEVTAGRKGLIVWGEPHNIQSWEATPGFLAKWSWAVEGCDDLIESTNRWRLIRGEDPLRRFNAKS